MDEKKQTNNLIVESGKAQLWRERMDRCFAWIERKLEPAPKWIAAQKLPLDPFTGQPIAIPQGGHNLNPKAVG